MKKNKKNRDNTSIINKSRITDLNILRIRKNILEETDPDHREEVEDFMKRYRDDTLTGL